MRNLQMKKSIEVAIDTIQITGDVNGHWFDVNSLVLSDKTVHAILEDIANHYFKNGSAS